MSFGQFASTTQFYLYGKKHCTQSGWIAASASYPQPDILDDINLDGKVFIITGANGGIGYEISSYLAKKQATLYLFCRSPERAEKAKEKIIAESNNTNVFVIICDCSLQRDVRRAWSEFLEHQSSLGRPTQLNGLLCNAGALSNEKTLTDEGIETTFAAHLLFGTYLLTKLAIPLLSSTPDSRVVVVSSGGMYNTKFPQWSKATSQIGTYDGQFAYAYSKRGQVLLCEEWTKQFPQIKFVSCHPGWVDTDGVTAAYGENKKYLAPMRTLWEGSEGIIWLLVAPSNELQGGEFYLDRTPRVKHMAGAFFTEGSFTKNTMKEIQIMLNSLEQWSELRSEPPLDWSVIAQQPLLPLQKTIEIEKFMGRWYVLGHIPTFLDRDTVNNMEEYTWNNETQSIEIVFSYCNRVVNDNGEAVAGPRKTVEQIGKIENAESTEWSLSVKLLVYWSVSLRYLIIGLDEGIEEGSYQHCMIGVSDRSGLWIMSRNSDVESVTEEVMLRYYRKAELLGYDVTKIDRVPYLGEETA